MAERPHIALVGFMLSGKSTIGRQLAAMLALPFRDSDDEIEHEHGLISWIFTSEGETRFRAYEHDAIATLLASDERSVVAVGGGAVAHEPTRALLAQRAHRVFLRVLPSEIHRRVIQASRTRPLLLGAEPLLELIEELYSARMPLYEEAEIVIDCDGLSEREICERLAERLREEKWA